MLSSIWHGSALEILPLHAAYWKQDPFKFKYQTNKPPCLQFQQINSSVLASFVEVP